VGVIWLAPLFGLLLYVWLGINRIERRARSLRTERPRLGSLSGCSPYPQIPGRLPLRWSQQEQIKKPGLLAAQVTATFAGLPELVGFLTSFLRRFDRRHPIVPDLRKTDSNSVRRTELPKGVWLSGVSR
jgi:hypothetical protein